MISVVLADVARWVLTSLGLTVYVFIFALVIICLVRASRYLRSAGKEQKLIRMEVGKIAEEVQLLRRELKGGKEGSSSAETG